VHPEDPLTVYLATAFFGADQVLRTTDGGGTWTSLDGDLPDIPVNVIGVDATTGALFAGTDAGLYRSTDDGAQWDRFGEGLPHAPVIDLLVEPERGRLVVGTQGRGAWLVPTASCAADVNGDGELDVLDFVAFQKLFVDEDPAADCDGNATLNVLDFVCFQLQFTAGCP